jgi:hypothetical protein
MTDERSQALCVIWKTTDEGKTWDPVKTADVPEFLKAPDVMANLLNGEMAQDTSGILLPQGARPWYRAERIDASGETVQ